MLKFLSARQNRASLVKRYPNENMTMSGATLAEYGIRLIVAPCGSFNIHRHLVGNTL